MRRWWTRSSRCSLSTEAAPDVHALAARVAVAPPSVRASTPGATLAFLGALLVFNLILLQAGWVPRWTATVAAMVAGPGALLITALAWRATGRPSRWWAAPSVSLLLITAVALAAVVHPAAGLSSALIPA